MVQKAQQREHKKTLILHANDKEAQKKRPPDVVAEKVNGKHKCKPRQAKHL